MRYTGKLAGGTLGLLLGFGPVGAALGVLLGHQLDTYAERRAGHAGAAGERFFQATFRVMGCLAKADGRVSEQEIAAARAIMAWLRLSPAQVQEAIRCFTAGKQPGFDLDAELLQLRRVCAGRADLTRMFVELQVSAAVAGSNLEGPVRPMLGRLVRQLGLSEFELARIEAAVRMRADGFSSEAAGQDRRGLLEQAYQVLEVSRQASDRDIVKAYRRQLSRHHPDKLKVNGLPESMLELAKQRTQQIIEAYELIRAQRGMPS